MFLNIGVSSYFERLKTDSKASASIKKQEGSYFDTFLIIHLIMIRGIKNINLQMGLEVNLFKNYH